jgi:hypothetical protein
MKPYFSVALACFVLAGPLSLPAVAADIDPRPVEGAEVDGSTAPREIVIERGRVRVKVIASAGLTVNVSPEAAGWPGPFVGPDLAPRERGREVCLHDIGFKPRSGGLDLDDFGSRPWPWECPAAGADTRITEVTIRVARRAESLTGQAANRPEAAGATTHPDARPAVPPPAPVGPK